MKKIFLLILITFFCTCTFATISNAQNEALSAKKVTQLFRGKTFTVNVVKPDKKTGKKISPFNVHASQNGMINIAGEPEIGTGADDARLWTVSEEGQFCYTRKLIASSRRIGGNCCFVVSGGSGTYKMYTLSGYGKRSKDGKNRKIVGGKGSTHLFTFSNFK
jgi:hypothetical protein